MILLSFLFSFIYSTNSSITVCFNSCPSDIYGEQVIVYNSEMLSTEISRYLSEGKTDIYFYNQTDHIFSIDSTIFEGHTVEFHKLNDQKYINVELDFTSNNGVSTGTFIIKDMYVDFSSILTINELQLTGLIVENSNIDLFSVKPKLIVESLTTDDSIKKFTTVNIKKSLSLTQEIILNVHDSSTYSISTIDNGFDLKHDDKAITFTYDEDVENKQIKVINQDLSSSSIEIDYKSSDLSKLIQFTFKDLNAIHFLNTWPESAIINIVNDEIQSPTIFSDSTIFPISISGQIQSKIAISQESTTISGDITSPIIFLSTEEELTSRRSILLASSFSGSLIDIGSSYFDVTMSNFAKDISGYGNLPFAFRVGKGGSSTLTVSSLPSTSTKNTGIYVYTDFDSYLPDESLQNLLTKEWTILTLTGCTFSLSYVNVMMDDSKFIHGFIKSDSCLTLKMESNQIKLTASPPSLLPLNICYDGDKEGGECKSKDGYEIDSVDSINDYFKEGMKYLNLNIKSFQLSLLDLSKIDYGYEGIQIILKGGSNTVINSIVTNEGTGISYLELNDIIMGTSTLHVKEIRFSNCAVDGHPTLTFKNCEQMTVDDNFIQKISPCISSSAKIQKISYRMDKYDQMTITDESFIFYDVEINDFSEPAELLFDVVGFLDVIYDIGIGPTAEENDLIVNMKTENPPSFNVTFSNLFSTGIWNTPELILKSWSRAKDADFNVYFIHDKIDSKVVFTQPFRPPQLKVIGTGVLTYEDRYNTTIEICTTATESDREICPEGTTYFNYQDLNNFLIDSIEENITIYIKSQSDNWPSIDLYSVDKKVTRFIGLSNEETKDIIEVTSSKDVEFAVTTVIFDNVLVKASSKTSSIVYGELKLIDSIIDSSFKNVEITVDNLYCEYKYLACFKQVKITDNLFVDGQLSTEPSTVIFVPDKNTNDLNATIISDSTLVVGDLYIKIGETKFTFGSVEDIYDIILYFEPTVKTVIFNKDEQATESLIPNVRIRKASGATFKFSDNWNVDTKRIQPHVFLFSDINKSSIYLAGQNTPISISADGEFSLISTSEKVGINGFFDFYNSETTINILSEKVTHTTVSLSDKISIEKSVLIKFSQPNVEFIIGNATSNSESLSVIQTEFFSNLDGDSRLIIQNPMKNTAISTDYKVQVAITEDVSSEKVKAYFERSHMLAKVATSDSGSSIAKSLTFIGTKPTTHGFTENNMNIKVNETTGEISLNIIQNPLFVPFTFCYGFSESANSCEFTLTEDNIDHISDLSLPSSPIIIQARFGQANTKPLNLDVQKIKGSTVFIQQQSQNQLTVKLQLGSGIISLLSLDKVLASVTDSSTFKIDRIELNNGAKIDQTGGFDTINIDFDSDWKENPIPPCDNKILINLTAPSLTFTSKGFIVGEDSTILASDYPNLTFQLDEKVKTKLEASDEFDQISSEITLYSKTKKFVLGSNWPSFSSSKINIKFDNDDQDLSGIMVTTSSYPFLPFTQLMEAPSIQFDPSVLPYTVPNNFTLSDIKSEIDFSNVKNDPDKSHISIDSIKFEGSSSLSARSEIARRRRRGKKMVKLSGSDLISIQKVDIADGSSSRLVNAMVNTSIVIDGQSSLVGDFDVSSNTEITMKWSLSKMPKIEFLSSVPSFDPSSIKILFNESTINGKENEYDEFLYNKKFELIRINSKAKCQNWKKVVSFESNGVDLFNDGGVFDLDCDDSNLVLVGARHVVSKDEKKKLPTGAIVGIVIAAVVVVAAIIVGVVFYIKKRGKQQSNEENFETTENTKDQYTK